MAGLACCDCCCVLCFCVFPRADAAVPEESPAEKDGGADKEEEEADSWGDDDWGNDDEVATAKQDDASVVKVPLTSSQNTMSSATEVSVRVAVCAYVDVCLCVIVCV